MKSKNFLLTGALLIVALFSVNGVMAEGPVVVKTDVVKVNLIFNPFQSIQVNPDLKEVNFVYDSPEDYAKGAIDKITQTLLNHLTVNHTGSFQVNVNSTGFKKGTDTAGTDTAIEGDHVKVLASEGTKKNESNTYVFKNPSLSAGDKSFFTSTGGGMGLHFNVTYDHTGWDNEDTYKNMTNGTEKSIFTAEVTYTITTL